jgi:PAS domain S-box-containing protein
MRIHTVGGNPSADADAPDQASATAEALAREIDFNAALLETVAALVCVIDREGRIIRFNRASEQLSGYTIDEVKERPFWEMLVPPDERPGVEAVVRHLVEKQQPNGWENHWITKSGARRLIRWSNTVLLDQSGRLSHIIGTGIDVTEQRRAEAAYAQLLEEAHRARESAERAERRAEFLAEASRVLSTSFEDYARMLSTLARPAVPYLADWCLVRLVRDDGVAENVAFAHIDPKKEALFADLDRGELDLPVRSRVPPGVVGGSPVVAGSASCVERFMASFPALGGSRKERVREVLHSIGMASYMAVQLAARGRVLGTMIFGSMDERRRYGPEHLLLAEALASRAALAVDNARLYREAQQAAQAREEFLIVASHELRTPLTSLVMAVQALLKKERAAGAGKGRSWGAPLLAAVERSTTRLAALVDDIVDVSRFAAGSPVPALEQVDLFAVVQQVLDRATDALRSAGCSVNLNARGQTEGRWDRQWLARVARNLISNAAKYGAGRPIEVGLEGSEETVRLTVQDHGNGIPMEEQPRIFERFERAVSVRNYGGLGIGLWLVRQMVEALGGTIRVDSRAGAGATFSVELPRRGPAEVG